MESLYSKMDHIFNLNNFRRGKLNGERLELIGALFRSQAAQASDVRDKVFALLNLAFDYRTYFTNPSYTRPIDDILHQITVSALQRRSKIDFVALLGNLKGDCQGPTWLPDWLSKGIHKKTYQWSYLTGRLSFLPETVNHVNHRNVFKYLTNIQRWRAAGETRAYVSISGSRLQVHGVKFDKIRSLSTNFNERNMVGSDTPLLKAGLPSPGKEDINRVAKKSFFHTLCYVHTGSYLTPGGSWTAYIEDFYYFWFLGSRKSARIIREEFPKLYEWLRANSNVRYHGSSLWDYMKIHPRLLFGYSPTKISIKGSVACRRKTILSCMTRILEDDRRLLVTDHEFIGWADRHDKCGDSIWILKGCSVPVIMRRRPNGLEGWNIIGDTYVHGIMNGQAAEGMEESEWNEVDIY